MKNNFIDRIKEYGPFGFVIVSALIAGAISYGSEQAKASLMVNNHEIRIIKLEQDNEETGKALARIDQRTHDIWIDLGHKD